MTPLVWAILVWPMVGDAQAISEAVLQTTGALETGDATISGGRLYDEYAFEAKAGQAVVLTLQSDSFDTFLLLLDSDGQVLAQNDDWNDSTDSTIGHVLPVNGTYWAWVGTLDDTGQGTYDVNISLTEPSHPIVQEAEADMLNREGMSLANEGSYPEALALYQQALIIREEIDDRRGIGSSLNNIGFIHSVQGDYRQALEYYQQALVISQEVGDRQGEGVMLNNIGFIYDRTGDYSNALSFFERSIAVLEEFGNKGSIAQALHNIGGIYDTLGEYQRALDYYQQSLHIRQEIDDQKGIGLSLNVIGLYYQKLGEYPEALDYYDQALSIRQEIGDRSGEGTTLSNIGSVYADLGEYEKALNFLTQSLSVRREIGELPGEAIVLGHIGTVHHDLGNYSQALSYHSQSLGIRQEIGDQKGIGSSLNSIGGVYGSLGRDLEALNYYEQALSIQQKIGNRGGEASALNNIGAVYSRVGKDSEALDYYEQALSIQQKIGDRDSEANTLHNIAYTLESLNHPILAVIYFKQSVNIYEAIRNSNQSLSQEEQQSFTETIASSYRKLADLLLQQDRVLEAQRVLDLLKVQELDEYLQGIRSENTTEPGIDLLPQETEFWIDKDNILAQAIPVATELQTLRQIPFPDRTVGQNNRIVALENQQGQILDQFIAFIESADVQQLISQLSRTAQEQDILTELNQLPTLQDNLADIGNAVLLYPLILEDRLELVLVTPDGPPTRHPVYVSRGQLTQTISDFQQALRDKNSSPEALAQQLYQWLIVPLEPALAAAEADTIIYAPDGPLRYIPLTALHNGNQWLAERYRVNNITAASLTDLNLRPSQKPDILAGAYSEVSHSIAAGGQTLTFAGLPYAGIEVDQLQNAFPTTPFFGNDFSRRNTEVLFNDHSIIHLATHAALLIGSPLESFILFGDGGQLTLEELKSWRGRLRSVDLVVLSACETGTGSIKDANGEEILGFGYLMQDAGARAVISSLWPVSDGGTQELMTNFYEALQIDGMTKAEALQQAQIALINGSQIDASTGERFVQKPRNPEGYEAASNSRLSHPYYWAPFILIGNGL
ncbi:MAG: tetratricopeptide repeat protein [Cyanobacteria bacterium P01_A01_bin.17]